MQLKQEDYDKVFCMYYNISDIQFVSKLGIF